LGKTRDLRSAFSQVLFEKSRIEAIYRTDFVVYCKEEGYETLPFAAHCGEKHDSGMIPE
jgi:hypothetical protein